MDRVVVIFARAPERGRVKTRLAQTLGDDEALRIYRLLAARVTTQVLGTPECSVTVCVTPDDGLPAVRDWLGGDAIDFEGQHEGDLGDRMNAAMLRRFGASARKVVVVGTDCPDVDASVLEAAFGALDDHDVVFGPAVDGGYYLVGTRRPVPGIFAGVPWSAADTLEVSLTRAAEQQLSVHLLPALADIDTAADWDAWLMRSKADP